jgi:uncharacterized membrane protein
VRWKLQSFPPARIDPVCWPRSIDIRFTDLERNHPSCRGQSGRRKIIDEIPQNDRTDPVKIAVLRTSWNIRLAPSVCIHGRGGLLPCVNTMSLVGKLHPLLVHFPIALVLVAAGAELAAMRTLRAGWRAIAVFNLQAGAAMAVATVIAGWVLAVAPFVDATPSLTAHRWAGVAAAGATLGAAVASRRRHLETARMVMVYRVVLFGAAALMAIAGHLGAALVWGADFLSR